jgi:hypothetical protein
MNTLAGRSAAGFHERVVGSVVQGKALHVLLVLTHVAFLSLNLVKPCQALGLPNILQNGLPNVFTTSITVPGG